MLRLMVLLVAGAIIGLDAMKVTEDDVPPPAEKPAVLVSTLEIKPDDAKKPVPPGLKPVGHGFPGKGVPQRPHVQVVVSKPVVAIQRPPSIHAQSKPGKDDDDDNGKPHGHNGKGPLLVAHPPGVVVAIKETVKEVGEKQPAQVVHVIKEIKEHVGKHPHKDGKEHEFKFPAEFAVHLQVIEAAIKAAKEQAKDGAAAQVCLPLAAIEAAFHGAKRHFHYVVTKHAGKKPNKDNKPLPIPIPDIKVQLKPAVENIVLPPADHKKPFLNDALPPQVNVVVKPVAVPLPFKPLLVKPIVKPVIVTLSPIEIPDADKEEPKQNVVVKPLPFKPLLVKPIVKPVIVTLPAETLVVKEGPKQVVVPKPVVVKPAPKPVKPIAPKPAQETHGADKPVGLSVDE